MLLFLILLLNAITLVAPDVLTTNELAARYQLAQLNLEVEHLKGLLIKECPSDNKFISQNLNRLETRNLELETKVEVRKQTYSQLLQALIECRQFKLKTTTRKQGVRTPPPTPPPTPPTTIPTTTTTPTTTTPTLPTPTTPTPTTPRPTPTPRHPTTTATPTPRHPTTTATPTPRHPTTTATPTPRHPTTTATPTPRHPTTTATPTPRRPTTTATPTPRHPTTTARTTPRHPTTTARSTPRHPTTTARSTPTISLPPTAKAACTSAMNLTESWRLDHAGSGIMGNGSTKACDLRHFTLLGRPWFRFTGTAGNRLLDTCPKTNSCGSGGGIWSNTQPTANSKIGFVQKFNAAGSYDSNCHRFTPYVDMELINCGNEDVVYRYVRNENACSWAFCGMN